MNLIEGLATSGLELRGLRPAPFQSYGSIRLVPILRDEVRDDLRLARRFYGGTAGVVQLDGRNQEKRFTAYWSYIPHALVMTWRDGDAPVACMGSHLGKGDGKSLHLGPFSIRLLHRMARREKGNRLRFLPLHVAMEGYLAIHFGGPSVAWEEYSRRALTRGLSPREESAAGGWQLPGLDEALRIFEIHPSQVGMAVFVADALASIFVVPCPEDYGELHRSLLEDFYGELLLTYGTLYGSTSSLNPSLDEARVASMADLRREVQRMRDELAEFTGLMMDGLLARPLEAQRVYQAGPFEMLRFMTDLAPDQENHLGEAIFSPDGTVQYLKTFRLSRAQTRRAYLLKLLALADWNLDLAAERLSQTRADVIMRLENAGFGYLLRPDVLAMARRRRQ